MAHIMTCNRFRGLHVYLYIRMHRFRFDESLFAYSCPAYACRCIHIHMYIHMNIAHSRMKNRCTYLLMLWIYTYIHLYIFEYSVLASQIIACVCCIYICVCICTHISTYSRHIAYIYIQPTHQQTVLSDTLRTTGSLVLRHICNGKAHYIYFRCVMRGGGLGSSTIFKNLMSPTPRRKWYLTTGRRSH